nr:MAG TPA: hypothetical protein [Caudoviricetes sp.]
MWLRLGVGLHCVGVGSRLMPSPLRERTRCPLVGRRPMDWVCARCFV